MASIHASQSASSSATTATWPPWPGVARSNASTDGPAPAQLALFGIVSLNLDSRYMMWLG
jgi:hypothetical protein